MEPPRLPLNPPFWARGAHAQTLWGHFLPSPAPELPWERLNLKLPDGDILRVRMMRGTSGVAVYLFHGLGGSADSDYIRRAAAQFWNQGHGVLAINHRGAGEGRSLAVKPYHMGSTADVAALIELGRGCFPDHLHVAIGFSLSATMLLLLMRRDCHLGLALPDRAIAVNPAVDPEKASLRLEKGWNRLYDLRFTANLRKAVRERRKSGLLKDPFGISPWATLRDCDALYTAPQAGFRDRDDYYTRCACGPHLERIHIPTVILTNAQDPFAPAEDLQDFKRSPWVHLQVEARGGHMGYLGKGVPGGRWMDYALDHFVRQLAAIPG